ncbi:protein misato homolog 1-like [Mercenaria mercenaria]|uniref:protein misato homolog 1-like n=1 Tax=Mercenaria mercenaria TaxID=6596 RepID=UPI00234E42CA|nr:protein misato homolog 1-like [Mercenaria mercenaria]
MSVKEVVTLQVGHYSNFVGAHWWNIQESSFVYSQSQVAGPKEICHDVLYREGENRRREVTFTPRLVAFDLKGSLKTLKQEGVLYETGAEGEDIKWIGDVTMHKEVSEPRNPFLMSLEEIQEIEDEDQSTCKDITDDEKYDNTVNSRKKKIQQDHQLEKNEDPDIFAKKEHCTMEDHVTVWSDFLGTNFHPKSVHIVEEYKHKDELSSFDLFNSSDEVFANYESTCEWEDRIRYFTEECDNLQGFHVLLDTHDGFGGLGAGIVRYLEEEFPGKGIFTFGFTPADAPDDSAQVRATRIINSALAYENVSTHSSLFVPVSLASSLWRNLGKPVEFPYLNYKSIPYHTSAILASALDTLSLPYRLETGAIDLRDITHSFNTQGRKVATLNTSFPLGLYKDESLIDFFSQHGKRFPWQPVTPHVQNEKLPFIQSVVMRGVTDSLVASKTDPQKLPEYLTRLSTKEEVLRNYLEHMSCGNLFASTCLESALKTKTPYPQLFSDNVTSDGFVSPTSRPADKQVDSVPMITSLQCTPDAGIVIRQLYDAVSRMNIKKHHRHLSAGLEEDDYEEILANLEVLAANYNTDAEAL